MCDCNSNHNNNNMCVLNFVLFATISFLYVMQQNTWNRFVSFHLISLFVFSLLV